MFVAPTDYWMNFPNNPLQLAAIPVYGAHFFLPLNFL